MEQKLQMSESYLLGAILAICGGFIEAYTYIVHGHAFAYAQTGNMIFFAMNMIEHNYNKASGYLFPVIVFAVGIGVAVFMKLKFSNSKILHWRQLVIFIEILIVFMISNIPADHMNAFVAASLSFITALQLQTFKKIGGNTLATTFCTGNLRTATEQLFLFFAKKECRLLNLSLALYGIIGFFIVGATLGVVFTDMFSYKSAYIPLFLYITVFCLMFMNGKVKE
ncbi:YoaK family protein [Paenibacillus marinisediminis]